MWGLEEKEKKALAFSLSGFYNKGWRMNNSCLLIPVNTCITYLSIFFFPRFLLPHKKSYMWYKSQTTCLLYLIKGQS